MTKRCLAARLVLDLLRHTGQPILMLTPWTSTTHPPYGRCHLVDTDMPVCGTCTVRILPSRPLQPVPSRQASLLTNHSLVYIRSPPASHPTAWILIGLWASGDVRTRNYSKMMQVNEIEMGMQ